MIIENDFEPLRDNLIEIKIIISKIEIELRNSQIDRSECKHFLYSLYATFHKLKDIIVEFKGVEESKLKEKIEKYVFNSLEEFIDSYQREFTRIYTSYNYNIFYEIGNKINNIAEMCDEEGISKPYYRDTSYVKNTIYVLINAFKIFIERINKLILKPVKKGIIETYSIKEFILHNPFGLNMNWIISTCYLCAIEILTISKRQELGIVKDNRTEVKLPFNQKLDELLKEIEDRGKHLDKKMLGFQKMLRDYRTQVIHYGYIPNDKELGLIIEYANKTLSELSKIKK